MSNQHVRHRVRQRDYLDSFQSSNIRQRKRKRITRLRTQFPPPPSPCSSQNSSVLPPELLSREHLSCSTGINRRSKLVFSDGHFQASLNKEALEELSVEHIYERYQDKRLLYNDLITLVNDMENRRLELIKIFNNERENYERELNDRITEYEKLIQKHEQKYQHMDNTLRELITLRETTESENQKMLEKLSEKYEAEMMEYENEISNQKEQIIELNRFLKIDYIILIYHFPLLEMIHQLMYSINFHQDGEKLSSGKMAFFF
ncbi:hypothetical protein P9112_012450 [Eukaryota sp. TZLM1-RC]